MTKIKQKTGFGKFTLVVLVILLAVSVSGCKGKAKECPVVVSQTDAIKILSFSPGYEDVPVGGSVRLSMDLQNGGNYEATDITADLWSHPGFGLGDDATQQFKTVPTLYPPDLSICSEGDAYSVQWDMQAGCDPRESIVAASVSYMYKSEGWASILLMSQQEAERLGGQTGGTGENFPSAGPVQIEIESLRNQPLIISENARSFSIRLKIQNTGDGLAGYKGSGYMNETTLTLSGPCNFTEGNNKELTYADAELQLRFGKQDLIKTLSLNYTGNMNFVKDFCTISVVSNYGYRVTEQLKGKFGIYGSSDEITNCRAQLTE
ncbi:TPA: hypothetical protein H1008_02740 [archaeon]|nr:hypothetical protein [Candidatus Undinarchaeales archaeon SRR5007147.bin71]